MTWISFSIYLTVGYIVYYTLNILFDLLKKPTTTTGMNETLIISDQTETIEVDDSYDDAVITTNSSTNEKDLTKVPISGVTNEVETQSEDQIIPSTVEVEISKSGGLSLKGLKEMYRLRAIQESNQLPFVS